MLCGQESQGQLGLAEAGRTFGRSPLTQDKKEEIDVSRRRLLFGFMDRLRGNTEQAPVAAASQTAPVLAQANEAFKAGNFAAAIGFYRAFLKAESDNAEARPLYCRLFPFWVRTGRERYFELDFCEAQREASSGAGLKIRLGMTSAGIRELYNELRTAWGLPERT